MGSHRFRLSNILPRSLCRARRWRCAKEQATSSEKALPVQTFDEMLLLSSSSRGFSRTEHVLPPLIPAQPRGHSSSNSDDSPRRRKMHIKCCHGFRWKVNSPRINAVNIDRRRKGLSERSVTVVKSSENPESDFKESMVEMIVENNITDLDGLEELLVSYLVLNSDEFHEVIVSVFKEVVIRLLRKPNKC